MPKIRLIRYFDEYESYFGDNDLEAWSDPMSEWQEVTDEELAYLTSPESFQFLNNNKKRYRVVVLKDETNTGKIQEFVHDIKAYIERNKKAIEDRKRKSAETARKKKETLEAKKIEKAKKVLAQAGILKE